MTKRNHNNIFLSVISSPFFLAVPVTFLIILFLPNPVSRYKVTLVDKHRAEKEKSRVTYCDLDGDSIDERIIQFHNVMRGTASIKVMTGKGYNYGQWNFPGHFKDGLYNSFACFDLNHDGYIEIYVFYHIDDSVFMGAFQPCPNEDYFFKKKFITTVWRRDNTCDYYTPSYKSADLNGDGIDELIVLFKAGYSRQPRFIFSYDLAHDVITKSPSVGAALSGMKITDLNNDHIPEIFVNTTTPENIPDNMGIPFSDYFSWFMGFDNNLRFLFQPVKRTGSPGVTRVIPLKGKTGKKFVAIISKDTATQKLAFTDSSFEITKEIDLTQLFNTKDVSFITVMNINGGDYLLFIVDNERFVLLDENFNITRKGESLPDIGFKFKEDINNDRNPEYIFLDEDRNLVIYDENLKNPVVVDVNLPAFSSFYESFGIKHNGRNQQNEIYVKTKDRVYYYSYLPDPWYYLKYPLWLGLYGFIVLILWFAQRLQQLNQRKKREVEEKLTTLQMKTIKNHMDPHFTFNVLNGLAGNIAKGNLDEAQIQIVRFSRLLQGLMKKRDTIYVTLDEELNFIRNYLELERLRFKENFEYTIDIDDNVNLMFQIPSMFIQILVENSLKHGLKRKPGVKKVLVSLREDKEKITVIVEDNGIGREAAKKSLFRTGSGLALLEDMIFLNSKLKGNEISYKYKDLFDDKGNPAGTRVIIEIKLESD